MFVQGIRPLSNTNSNAYSKTAFCANPKAITRAVEQHLHPSLVADTFNTKAPTIQYAVINGKYGMVIENPKKSIKLAEPKPKEHEVRKFDSEDETTKNSNSDDERYPCDDDTFNSDVDSDLQIMDTMFGNIF